MLSEKAIPGYFITGTDTDCGKTVVSLALLHAARHKGLRTAAMKPISCGCYHTPNGFRNEDAVALQQAASIELPYNLVNPIAFAPPISPNIAATRAAAPIALDQLVANFQAIKARAPEWLLVEGCGGWLVPLDEKTTLAELARALQLPVLLVVGLRLGCLNHSLLTVAAIQQSGLPLAGWIANHLSPDMDAATENIQTLEQHIPAPRWATLPYQTTLDIAQLGTILARTPKFNT